MLQCIQGVFPLGVHPFRELPGIGIKGKKQLIIKQLVFSEWTQGSNKIWMAVLGPDTPALGERKDKSRFFQNQVAKTVAAFLGYEYSNKEQVGEVLGGVVR